MPRQVVWADQTLDKTIKRLRDNKPIAHLSIPALDCALGGVRRSRVTYICGEPGAGKTSLLNQIKTDLASEGLIVCYVSYEVDEEELTAKSLARASDGRISINTLSFDMPLEFLLEKPLRDATEAYREVAENITYDMSRPSTIDISVQLGRIIQEKGRVDALLVDYLQQIPPSVGRGRIDERSQAMEAVAGLRKIAMKYRIPVFVVSSINRQNYEKTAVGLSALGGTSAIEYDADAIIHLSVEGKGEERKLNLEKSIRPVTASILKNRFGPTATAHLDFHANFATFSLRDITPWRRVVNEEELNIPF